MAGPRVFRLHPESPAGLYVRVRVHPTLKAMRRHLTGLRGRASLGEARRAEHSFRRALGACTEWGRWTVTGRRARRDACVAEVNLAEPRLGTTVVTHELFHASICWGRRIGMDFGRLDAEDSVNDDEERLAYVHGELCRQFIERAYAEGLYA